MLKHLRPALILLAALTALTGVLYPLAVTAIATLFFPARAGGSLIERDGRVLGSALIGQACDDPRWFWGRPSATAAMPCDAAHSTGSNLGPTNPALLEALRRNVARLRAADPGNDAPIPVDLVTSSASGLDPHISPAAALWQVPRVARARGLDEARVRALVLSSIEERTFGLLGEPRVAVLPLNLALEALQ